MFAHASETLEGWSAHWAGVAAPEPAGFPRLGDILGGRYQLVSQVGEGGMATVFEAHDLPTGRRFAIKVLHAAHLHRLEMCHRFECEARVYRGLDHENVVAVVDSRPVATGAPYIVMEYLKGESLAECLWREGPLPVPRALDIVMQACSGLAAAHALGVVHRDVKPENLFLCRRRDGSDLVKVIDFGIAKVSSGFPWLQHQSLACEDGYVMGTPRYMCPEQVVTFAHVDRRADVYSLGVVLFEALSGERPHAEPSNDNTLPDSPRTEAPRRLDTLRSTLPSGLADVVHKALAFDPDERFGTMQELGSALRPYAFPLRGIARDLR